MRRLLLLIATVMLTTTLSAQGWSVGVRTGAAIEAMGGYNYNDSNYVEMRAGVSWLCVGNRNASLTLLHNWQILEMDWTPEGGTWFFDAGVGAGCNWHRGYLSSGAVGMARLGYNFRRAPLAISLDYSPMMGITTYRYEYYTPDERVHTATCSEFYILGLYNAGISLTYRF